MRSHLDNVTTNAAWLADAWDPLYESRLKGTPRRWRQTEITPARRALLDAAHRAEKQAHGAPAGADSPAPIHLDVFDLATDLITSARRLATVLATYIQDDAALVYITNQNNHHPPHLLQYISTNAHRMNTDGDDIAEKVMAKMDTTLHHLRQAIASQFNEVVEGQRLKANCPWCANPKLYFRAIGPEHSTEMVVQCESGACEPAAEYCGTRHRGNPCWPFHEWKWLAGHINRANPEPQAQAS